MLLLLQCLSVLGGDSPLERRDLRLDYDSDCQVASFSSSALNMDSWKRLSVWFLQTFCLFPPSLLPGTGEGGREGARGRQAGGRGRGRSWRRRRWRGRGDVTSDIVGGGGGGSRSVGRMQFRGGWKNRRASRVRASYNNIRLGPKQNSLVLSKVTH